MTTDICNNLPKARKKAPSRGGFRKGSGRKRIEGKKRFTFYLTEARVAAIPEKNASAYIDSLLPKPSAQ